MCEVRRDTSVAWFGVFECKGESTILPLKPLLKYVILMSSWVSYEQKIIPKGDIVQGVRVSRTQVWF